MDFDNEFMTKNIWISAFFLVSKQVKFLGTRQVDPQTKAFIFTPADKASTLEAAYLSNESVPARELFEAYKNLREMLKRKETYGS